MGKEVAKSTKFNTINAKVNELQKLLLFKQINMTQISKTLKIKTKDIENKIPSVSNLVTLLF